MREPKPVIIHLLVFITSFAILAYEINFTRVYAYAQWHNLSALIITMALLGFGASGSLIAILHKKIEIGFSRILNIISMLFPVSLCTGFIVSTQLDFNPYELSFSLQQVMQMFAYFFLMGIGFFLGASIICMALMKYKVSFTYFMNLVGSAAGVVFVLGISFILHPYDIMMVIILISLAPVCLLALEGTLATRAGAVFTTLFTISAVILSISFLDLKQISQYKPVSGALTLPDAKIIHQAYSPLGVVEVVQAKGLRSTAGLSLVSPFQVPVQKVIFYDGEGSSPITPYSGNPEEISYLRYLTSYLPFDLLYQENRNNVLIIGSGGGESILRAVLSGFNSIDALEADLNVINLMKNEFAALSGNIYNFDKVNAIHREARNYIRHTEKKYDLIELSMIDAYSAAASGVYGLNESYLYTVDSIKDYIGCLTDNGMLAVTRWVMTPARDNLKLFNMAVEALKDLGVENVPNHLIAVRSLQTLTLLIMKNEVSASHVEKARSFAGDRLFDLVYYPGMVESDANRHIHLETPVFYLGIKELLSNNRRHFIDEYEFDIRSATDNRPYFYNFFKPAVVKLIKTFGPSQVPVTEWGYFLLVIILLPVAAISALLIPAPLFLLKKRASKNNFTVFLYFSLIGAGYFSIEMPLIQKMILFLGQPVYAISVIIALILVFSGIGSYFSDKIFYQRTRILISTILIVIISLIYIFSMDILFQKAIGYGFIARVCLVGFLIAPLGFFMGIPFPAGLSILKAYDDTLTPWAWGVNGFFSVISILTATLLAVMFGFKAVLTMAAFLYLAAGFTSLYFSFKGPWPPIKRRIQSKPKSIKAVSSSLTLSIRFCGTSNR